MSFDTLQIVSDINASLAASKDGRANVQGVLDALRENLRLRFCFLVLEGRDDGRLALSAASGLTISEFRKLEIQTDGGAFRKVFESVDPLVIGFGESGVQLEFDNSSRSRLIATPLVLADGPIGVLAAITPDAKNLGTAEQLLRIAASMISQSLRIERAVHG